VGLGRIGTLVAQRLAAFGVELVAYDPYAKPERAAELRVALVPLDTPLETSDVITVHLFEQYLVFYQVAPSAEDRPAEFLRARMENEKPVILLAGTGLGAVGSAQICPAFSSLPIGRAWTLNDLYVEATARRCGAGRAPVRSCLDLARAAGAVGVQLETARDNTDAQALCNAEGSNRKRSWPTSTPWARHLGTESAGRQGSWWAGHDRHHVKICGLGTGRAQSARSVATRSGGSAEDRSPSYSRSKYPACTRLLAPMRSMILAM
jgi:GNAT superfamily N-acetyltransferase